MKLKKFIFNYEADVSSTYIITIIFYIHSSNIYYKAASYQTHMYVMYSLGFCTVSSTITLTQNLQFATNKQM